MDVTESTTSADVLEYVKGNVPARLSLYDVDQGEGLTPTELQDWFISPEHRSEVETEIFDRIGGSEIETAFEQINELVGDEAYAVLRADQARTDSAIEIMQEKNTSDPINGMLRQTGEMLIRYRLSEDWDDFPISTYFQDLTPEKQEAQVAKLASIANVSLDRFHDQLYELVENSGGGSPELVWYAKPTDLIEKLAMNKAGDAWKAEGSLTFKDPVLLLIDNMNGRAFDSRLKDLTLTVPFNPDRIVIDDAKGNGYGLDAICSVVKSWYRTDVKYEPPTIERKVEVAGLSL